MLLFRRPTISAIPSFIRIYFPNDSYTSVPLTPVTTAGDCCKYILDRLCQTEKEKEICKDYTYSIYCVIKNKESPLQDSAIIQQVIAKWKNSSISGIPTNRLIFKSPKGDPLPRDLLLLHTLKALELPIQVVSRMLNEMLQHEIVQSHPETEDALKKIRSLITSTNLYDMNFNKLSPLDYMDFATKHWLAEVGGIKAASPSLANYRQLSPHPIEDKPELREWSFDVFKHQHFELYPMFDSMLEHFGLLTTFNVPRDNLRSFLLAVRDGYSENPYHNFYHAFDVAQTVYCFLTAFGAKKYLTALDIFALLIASLCHDIHHPGKNNAFLVETNSELAVDFNDKSVLENFHASSAFNLLMKKDYNILVNLSKQEWKLFRKIMIHLILQTDMAEHVPFCTRFKQRLDLKEDFKQSDEQDRLLIMTMLLKCADVSNISKPWEYSKKWADRVTQEFFEQGDCEKKLNMPVAPFMDREKAQKSKITANFIDFVAGPIFDLLETFLPETSHCTRIVKENRKLWEEQQKIEPEPAPLTTSASVVAPLSLVSPPIPILPSSTQAKATPASRSASLSIATGKKHKNHADL
eukprot:TRINITY_DN7906_c0_g1_i1.p1 TRINITY_DN7906_c0_g1~~TRINITY_DN7906_c0_g1_i1.p1  ORF type:complete len:579 (+),score=102.78 TRINITY_DN7906_c0_g1_i1:51-1787(+)